MLRNSGRGRERETGGRREGELREEEERHRLEARAEGREAAVHEALNHLEAHGAAPARLVEALREGIQELQGVMRQDEGNPVMWRVWGRVEGTLLEQLRGVERQLGGWEHAGAGERRTILRRVEVELDALSELEENRLESLPTIVVRSFPSFLERDRGVRC